MSVTAGAIALGAGISALGGLAQSAMSNSAASNLNEVNRDFQREMYARQLADTERLYAQYNSPSALKRQYLEAGLNPSLVGVSSPYHGGNITAPTANSSPSSVMPDFSGIGAAGATMGNALVQQANISNQQSEALVNIGKFVKDAKDAGMSDDEINRIITPWIHQTQGIKFNEGVYYKTQLEKYYGQQETNDLMRFQNHLNDLYGVNKGAAELMNLRTYNSKMVSEIERLAVENKVSDAEIKSLLAKTVESYASALKLRKEGDKFVAETSTINAIRESLTRKLRAEANLLGYRDVEEYAGVLSRTKARSYLMSDEAQENILGKTQHDVDKYFYAIERASDVIDKWLPDMFVPMNGSSKTTTGVTTYE